MRFCQLLWDSLMSASVVCCWTRGTAAASGLVGLTLKKSEIKLTCSDSNRSLQQRDENKQKASILASWETTNRDCIRKCNHPVCMNPNRRLQLAISTLFSQ